MTTEEKANYYVDKFMPHVYCYLGSGMLTNDYSERVAKKEATECAIKLVDELIKEVDDMRTYIINKIMRIDYLTAVKTILEQRINKQK